MVPARPDWVEMSARCVRRAARHPAGFTLVEALVAISITAIAASVLLLGIQSSAQTTEETLKQTIALGMAEQLLDQVLGSSSISELEDYELTYDGVPAVDPWGVPMGTEDRGGEQRHPGFQAPGGVLDNSASFFDRWLQRVEVYPLSESDLTTSLTEEESSDCRVVEVRIVYDDPRRGRRELANLRRVVAYVPH
jgi:prepilin-type N-terminal cleavage/methylation domain-containing protein